MPIDKTFYKIGTLAREVGVSASLLRAWEKRYGLWTPERGPGGQRLYSEEDLHLVCHIAEATRQGLRIGELAALGRETLLQQMVAGNKSIKNQQENSADRFRDNIFDTYITPLVTAAETVNFSAIRDGLNRALLELSPDRVVYEVILPAMLQVGEAYLDGKISIAGEHLMSSMAEHHLNNCIEQAGQATPAKERLPVLCSCFPEEEHRLGLLSVMYTLAREGCEPIYLGSSLPMESLEQAILQIQPHSVWLSVTNSLYYDKYRNELAALAGRHSTHIILGGQGIRAGDTLLTKFGCKLCSPVSPQPAAVQSFLRQTSQ